MLAEAHPLWDAIDSYAIVVTSTQFALAVLGVIYLASGLDDLFIDACFWLRALYRATVVRPKIRPLSARALQARPEQPIAILLPAWDEATVLEPMLARMLRTIDYRNFVVYVGVYPNDAATRSAAARAAAMDAHIRVVMLAHNGPTNKADCLNAIWRAVRTDEREGVGPFAIFVMQDCEDVIHPLAWRLFNWLIPRKDMVQLPVLSLPRRWWQFTAAHYIDEFAQQHLKDLVARESLHRSLPAAGVGVALSRRAMLALAEHGKEGPFRVGSLTEDYELGFRLRDLGLSQIFVKQWMEGKRLSRHPITREWRRLPARELICVREYFPDTLRAAVRQKSRWIIGIALQGWRTMGWRGSWMTRYMLARDRKVLITSLAAVAGYLLLALLAFVWLWEVQSSATPPTRIVEPGGLLWYLLIVNLGVLAIRAMERALFTGLLYGPMEAALSLPRMVWGTVINALAALRALRLWARHLRTGHAIGWDKTKHQFPHDIIGDASPAASRLAVQTIPRRAPDHGAAGTPPARRD